MTRYVLDAVEITTEIRPGDPYAYACATPTSYIAFANGNRRIWEAGRSEEAAIGKLVVSLALGRDGGRC